MRHKFPGSETIKRNFSQAGQDLFVLTALSGKRNGVFLDIGCNQPIRDNNTYLLESEFGWNGLSIDIDPDVFSLYLFRRTKRMLADGTRLNWDQVLEVLGTDRVDYLSLDLEPAASTLSALKTVPFDRVAFSVVTFEHDAYRFGDDVRKASREIFHKSGYERVCSDVRVFRSGIFEDWYCHPEHVDPNVRERLASNGDNWEDILLNVTVSLWQF